MGLKLAVVIVPLDGRALADVASDVYQASETLSVTDLSSRQGMNPARRDRYALAHDRFAWICDWRLIERSFKKTLAVKEAHSFVLHSVVNWYGFATAHDGKFLRNRHGDADSGIITDLGPPTATERALVSRDAKPGQEAAAWQAWTQAGETFDGQVDFTDAKGVRATLALDGMTHDTIGETIVLGLMNALVGFQLNKESPALEAFENARVMRIEPAKRSWFGWLSR